MEHADWLHSGFDSSQARFLMLTAITHHRFGSPAWGKAEVHRLYAELTAIDAAAHRLLALSRPARPVRQARSARAAHPSHRPFLMERPAGEWQGAPSLLSRVFRRLRSAFRRKSDAASVGRADRPAW